MKTSLKLSIKIPKQDKSILSKPNIQPEIKSTKECTHIIDGIYLSGYEVSLDHEFLKQNKFTHIINCASNSRRYKPYYYEDFKYLILDMKDDPDVLIDGYVEQVVQFITESGCGERKILIHCLEGISRAPTLLISYLILKLNMNRDEALSFVKGKRPCVDINLGFMCQLEKLSSGKEEKREKFETKICVSC